MVTDNNSTGQFQHCYSKTLSEVSLLLSSEVPQIFPSRQLSGVLCKGWTIRTSFLHKLSLALQVLSGPQISQATNKRLQHSK